MPALPKEHYSGESGAGANGENEMEAIAIWLAGTAASHVIQTTLWVIPVTQTIHILSVAMVFSSVVMIECRILGVTKSQTIEQTAHRFVPWIFGGIVVLALTGSILIIGEPRRSLPSYEFQMKMLYLAVAVAFTIAFVRSVRQHVSVWETAGGTTQNASGRMLVNALALVGLFVWSMVVIYGRWIAYTVQH
jgi:hypothetical protein